MRFQNISILLLLISVQTAASSTTHKNGSYTPLHHAARYGDKERVKLLLKNGAGKNDPPQGSFTPLHNAAQFAHEEIVEYLLQAKADVHAQSKTGMTPLFLATFGPQKPGVIQALIDAGADVEHKILLDITPLLNVLTGMLRQPNAHFYSKTVYMLLLIGNASLDKVNTFPPEAQNLLKTMGISAYALEKNKEYSKQHKEAFIDLLESYKLPKVIARLIFEYHDCFDTRMLLFEKTRSLIENS